MTGALSFLAWLPGQLHWFPPPSYAIAIPVFVWFICGFSFLGVYSQRGDARRFVVAYLISITGKLLLSGAFVLVIFTLDPDGGARNAAYFMILYAVQTGTEIVFLRRPRRN